MQEPAPRLILPCENPVGWARAVDILSQPLLNLDSLDAILNSFADASGSHQRSVFFKNLTMNPDAAAFDAAAFWAYGAPLMISVAMEMPSLFDGVEVPLLVQYSPIKVTLSRRQCACLLAHSVFGSITAAARSVGRERWAFRAAQLFFLEATPSALCVLNYFKKLGQDGYASGTVTFERCHFARRTPPWDWSASTLPLCPMLLMEHGSIEESPAHIHVDFANKFIGGGALENDAAQEEILFALKPELIVSMALCSYLQNEEAICIRGALQYSRHSGYGTTFRFEGDCAHGRDGPPPTVVAIDALQGCSRIQFGHELVLRDLNKARIGFEGATSLATGNWGCGAFGNDHTLKFLQQWLAASEARIERVFYYTFGDVRADCLTALEAGLRHCTVSQLWEIVLEAAAAAAACERWQEGAPKFREHVLARARLQSTDTAAER
jgi:hypothetical protein